jgi:hypothetical protein
MDPMKERAAAGEHKSLIFCVLAAQLAVFVDRRDNW